MTNKRVVDKRGLKIGRWLVLEYAGIAQSGGALWFCVCDCGTFRLAQPSLRGSKSCGCLQRERASESNITHNKYKHKLYFTFHAMLQRCQNPNDTKYMDYGGRGITVCDRWNPKAGGSFESFLEDMGERPEGMSLDRIDNNGNYCKDNCRWADLSTQNINQRRKKTNTSGKTGVGWRANRGTWRARIKVGGYEISLGHFEVYEDAVLAREQAELKYYGFTRE